MAKQTVLNALSKTKRTELKATTDEMTREIAEKFAKLFTEKVEEMVAEFGAHLDEHMDALEGMIEEGFASLHEHLKTADRVEKLEKKIEEIETTGKGKRFVV